MRFNTKKLGKEINRIAKSLPELYGLHQQKRIMTGRDVHLSGLDTEGIPMNDVEFTIEIPVYVRINHKRLLSKAYKRNGLISIIDYVNKCYKMPILDSSNT